ncbi:hypothetical protein BH11BAC4_BH11BAC4_18950 [soil metagenome]
MRLHFQALLHSEYFCTKNCKFHESIPEIFNPMHLFLKLFLFFIALVGATDLSAQDSSKHTIKKRSSFNDLVFLDFNGTFIPGIIAKKLLSSGDYAMRTISGDTMMVYQLSVKEKERRDSGIANRPRPAESNAFFNGDRFTRIKVKDIYGNKIDTKALKGKIIVLNYWFINCPPCRMEIPELNKIVADYKTDSSVVFIAIALDDAEEIVDFISSTPFDYKLIAEGKFLDDAYKIKGYPTNVVIDKEGKVYFSSLGYGAGIVFWIRKSIEEIKQKPAL